jgi:DNA-binding transcriptional MerR regulator
MSTKLIPIGEAAKMMQISIDTLRRWDKSGRFLAVRRSGKRFYRASDIEDYLQKMGILEIDLYATAKKWVSEISPGEPEEPFYCQNSAVFQTKLIKLQKKLGNVKNLENTFPLIVAIAGEIGNNSFDHNIGHWHDVPGVFFGYDTDRREIVLADRGQGILKTLSRIRKDLRSDAEALKVAFTEIVSGRSPEARGNGLKFVRTVISENDIALSFQTGNAKLELRKGNTALNITQEEENIYGCIALIKF